MDVVTLGAALSIMKKMPDTAASSAAAAENAADRAEQAAEYLSQHPEALLDLLGFYIDEDGDICQREEGTGS